MLLGNMLQTPLRDWLLEHAGAAENSDKRISQNWTSPPRIPGITEKSLGQENQPKLILSAKGENRGLNDQFFGVLDRGHLQTAICVAHGTCFGPRPNTDLGFHCPPALLPPHTETSRRFSHFACKLSAETLWEAKSAQILSSSWMTEIVPCLRGVALGLSLPSFGWYSYCLILFVFLNLQLSTLGYY